MIKKSARNIALEALNAVDQDQAYSNIALNRVMDKYQPEKIDRGFITELVYGTLRNLGTVDWVLGDLLKKPLSDLPSWIRNILRMGVYQILYLDKVPDSAACNESVNLAKQHGHAGTVKLVNGVLRNVVRKREQLNFPDISEDPVKAISIQYSHPEWLVARWVNELGVKGAEALCRANNEIPPNSIRTNTLKITRNDLKELLAAHGLEVREGRLAPETLLIDNFKSIGKLPAHEQGLFMVQDESSTLVGHALGLKPGSFVIDACSAPGGKSTHMAQMMNNQGRVISVDIHPHKMTLIKENAARLGVEIIQTEVLDATQLDRKFAGQADYVLVDAPCTGLGIIRRRPEIKWRKNTENIVELSRLQLNILTSAAKCLKPGGVLVYSTCTVTKEETIDVINSFIKDNSDFALESLRQFLPDGLEQLPGTATIDQGYVQFLPHVHGIDGFFIARLKKESDKG